MMKYRLIHSKNWQQYQIEPRYSEITAFSVV